MNPRKAFTLIELLIVVAIIAILAAIAVPNFLEAQTRSKVSRTKADMRSLATAIESYRVDNNRYIWTRNYIPEPYAIPGGFYQDNPDSAYGLTTPISYITSVPEDPFGGARDPQDLYANLAGDDYFYATKAYFESQGFGWRVEPGGEDGSTADWVLQSKGPDKAWAINTVLELDQPYKWQYDPTNGTISLGNVVRSGP